MGERLLRRDLSAIVAKADVGTLRRTLLEVAEDNPEVQMAMTMALGRNRSNMKAVRSDLAARLVGHSTEMLAVREAILQVAPTGLSVLITGESGTGKDLVAREIHAHSERSSGPFVAVNCGAIPPTLISSELFGHERGAFTGAVARQIGQIEQASGGTLFLDEIGELPRDVQASLLRFLQDFKIRRIGGTREFPVDCRIVAATNADLLQATNEGRFRQDLFFRLDVFSIHLPPVRDRGDDVLFLAEHFTDVICKELHRPAVTLAKDARDVIQSHGWPGNVRELSHKLRKAIVMCVGDRLTAVDLGLGEAASAGPVQNAGQKGPRITRAQVVEALRRNGGNVSATGRELGVSRVTVYKLINRYGIDHT